MRKDSVKDILAETEAGYDRIAGKFSQTRKFFWRGLEFIGDYVRDGDRVLDFGCGNGRLLEILGDKKIDYVGVDVSRELVDIAAGKYAGAGREFRKISGSDKLPFPDGYFNVVYSIAVFHHLPSYELRLEIAKEMARVLRPDGRIVVTVWNLWQRKYLRNLIANWTDKLIGRSRLDWQDCHISFQDNSGRKFQRYHHAYRISELSAAFSRSGFAIERAEVVSGRNILIVAKKI